MFKKTVVIFLMLAVVAGTAFVEASTGNRQIEVAYRDISVLVNGVPVSSDQEPFVFEGRTFVPIRFISQALGKNVTWDQAKYEVRIADPLKLGKDFSGKTLYVSRDFQVFSVVLEGNPTTGYSWEVKDFDQSLVQLLGEPTYTTQTSTNIVGAGGDFTFNFLTQGKSGELTLEFIYLRPWESVPPIEEFTLKVKLIEPEEKITLTEEDSGSAVYLVMPLNKMEISLPGNPSAGYSWEVQSCDGEVLALEEEPSFDSNAQGLGAPGIFTFKFAPISPGITDVKLIYVKAGESGPPEKEFQLLVGVF
ncbi:MAG: protease inhibitor I42 family protein [Caldiserica bacterium]|jgi:predicted secreted protein|nr:protease inhibitor I42 family protein [Caldisericota bacterium]MDH7562378.1 protease inhibitor I42 family protein [Caldisericota bacterium]